LLYGFVLGVQTVRYRVVWALDHLVKHKPWMQEEVFGEILSPNPQATV